jgi:hypothetical protein
MYNSNNTYALRNWSLFGMVAECIPGYFSFVFLPRGGLYPSGRFLVLFGRALYHYRSIALGCFGMMDFGEGTL